MTRLERLGRVAAASVLLSAIAASAAFGYEGQVAGQVSVAGPSGQIACNTPISLSATVLDINGVAFDNTTVTWTFASGKQSGDTISPATSTTDASGVATTSVTLACVVGTRTVDATAGTSVGSAVLGLTSLGLPNTSTAGGPAPAGTPALELGLAALAVLAGLALVTRRVARQ